MKTVISGSKDPQAASTLAIQIAEALARQEVPEVDLCMGSTAAEIAAEVFKTLREKGRTTTIWAAVTVELLCDRVYTGHTLYFFLRRENVKVALIGPGSPLPFDGEPVLSPDKPDEIALFLCDDTSS